MEAATSDMVVPTTGGRQRVGLPRGRLTVADLVVAGMWATGFRRDGYGGSDGRREAGVLDLRRCGSLSRRIWRRRLTGGEDNTRGRGR